MKYAEPGSIPNQSQLVQLAVAQHHGPPTRLLDWTVSPRVALHFATGNEEHFDRDGAIWCVDVVKARELLPISLRGTLDKYDAYVFSKEILEDAGASSLDAFDQMDIPGHFVVFFEPPSLDARIVNQWAILSIMPGATLGLHDFLGQNPVTERMLFPGLDGLSRWLKRYYGLGPVRSGGA